MMLRHAARLVPAVALAAAALLAGPVSQAPAANGVQVADGTSLVEADPNAPDPVETIESDTLPFNATASSSSSLARQNTTFVDSGTGITFNSASHLAGSDLDFAFTQMVRRFTVTAPSLPVKISGLVDDKGTGGGGDWLQTVVFRQVGGGDVFAFNDDDDDDFSGQAELTPGTYELVMLGECVPGSGETCSADLSARLELGEVCASEVKVGFATAKGCFTETAPGSGIFRTGQRAWVGGFEIVPRGGGQLVLNTNTRDVSTSGAGADIVFAGFRVPIPVGALPVDTPQATVSFGGGAGTVAEVLDVPVEASVKVAWADNGRSATYEQKVAIKELTKSIGPMVTPPGTVLGDFGGSLEAKLENGVGFVLQRGEVSISKLTLLPDKLKVKRPLEFRDLLLRFERKDNKPFWTGRAGITLPIGRDGLGFTGTVFVFDGSPAGGGLAVSGINKQLGATPLFLQDVSGDLLFAPRFGHDLAIAGSLGPRVGGKQLLKISGQMKGGELITPSDCPSGDDPERLLLSSKLTPLEPLELAGLAEAEMSLRGCVYPYAGLVPSMDVTAQVGIGFAGGALAYEASQTGFVSSRGANLEGAATLKIPAIGDINGSAIVSTKGTAACATVGFFDAGFGHRWGGGVPSAFTGCDLKQFRVTARARGAGAHASGAEAIEVPKGLPHAGFAATAQGGPPPVTVSGPGGLELSSPADGSVLRTPQALIVPVANEDTTYAFVRKPKAGEWRVDSTDPDNPLTKVGFAEGLDDPKVKAKVAKPRKKGKKGRKKGKGAKKLKLAYKLKRIPGQEVTFTERGAGIAQELGTARGRKGTISFKPTIAADRKRTIEAEVAQDGLPRDLVTVARFKAPKQPKIGKPKVKAKRKPDSLKLSWKRVKGAADYVVEVSAGAEVLHRVITPKRKLRLDGTPAEGKLAVTVQALSDAQPPGPVARLTVKKARKGK